MSCLNPLQSLILYYITIPETIVFVVTSWGVYLYFKNMKLLANSPLGQVLFAAHNAEKNPDPVVKNTGNPEVDLDLPSEPYLEPPKVD